MYHILTLIRLAVASRTIASANVRTIASVNVCFLRLFLCPLKLGIIRVGVEFAQTQAAQQSLAVHGHESSQSQRLAVLRTIICIDNISYAREYNTA